MTKYFSNNVWKTALILQFVTAFSFNMLVSTALLSRFTFQSTKCSFRSMSSTRRLKWRSYCIGKEAIPIAQPQDGVRRDADLSWQTNPTEQIECFAMPRPHETGLRPKVISFDAFDTLIQPSQSVGRWYREGLNHICDMRVRLPRPKFFSDAFKVAYADM